MFGLRRVTGNSMLPGLKPGSIVFYWRQRRYQPGDVVVARFGDKQLVKRVATIDQRGYRLRGDNADDSFDSRQFGSLPPAAILGRVVGRLSW